MPNLEETMTKLKLQLNLCHKEKERLNDVFLLQSDLETVVYQLKQERQRQQKVLQLQKENLTLEVERMMPEHEIKHQDKSPSHLDTFLKGIEELHYYKQS
jgi:centrosomal protein CEP135